MPIENHVAVVDLGFGDSGKGILTARLCETNKFSLVVKANGGCQCAHNVVLPSGEHFSFSQFGSGSFSNIPTYLTKDFKVEPFSLLREAEGLAGAGVKNPLDLMNVAWNALLTTPYHWLLNQWQEDQRGENRHGSTGRGIGVTAQYALENPEAALTMGDVHDQAILYTKLHQLRDWVAQRMPDLTLPSVPDLYERYYRIADKINVVGTGHFTSDFTGRRIVFEGSQGVLLDEDYGFHPHTTWSKTTDFHPRETAMLLTLRPREQIVPRMTVVGVTRAYTTRHGMGPFVTESDSVNVPEDHNDHGPYQGAWRQGHLDLHALRYAISVCEKVDGIYVTHTDSTEGVQWCEGYEVDGEPFELQALDPTDIDARLRQTESLYKAQPVLRPAPNDFVAQRLAEALATPLYGWGSGPQTDQGQFSIRGVV